jgi:hypothetical protein
MTGPEHYREAARLLGYLDGAGSTDDTDAESMVVIGTAQVHATLALAAATAAGLDDDLLARDDWKSVGAL